MHIVNSFAIKTNLVGLYAIFPQITIWTASCSIWGKQQGSTEARSGQQGFANQDFKLSCLSLFPTSVLFRCQYKASIKEFPKTVEMPQDRPREGGLEYFLARPRPTRWSGSQSEVFVIFGTTARENLKLLSIAQVHAGHGWFESIRPGCKMMLGHRKQHWRRIICQDFLHPRWTETNRCAKKLQRKGWGDVLRSSCTAEVHQECSVMCGKPQGRSSDGVQAFSSDKAAGKR